ncbi:MAG: phosphoenolpyruvate--protein phosphotransferase [Candidatus Riflebacteria bacterium]|nr:phosphoenolpyruvate--protein phosphotransferase [Candidatus Riflebacteria bacterium]
MTSTNSPLILKGIAASPGVCIGKVYLFKKKLEVEKRKITESQVEKEIERLHSAIELTRRDIATTQKEARIRHGDKYAAIFDSHLLMLDDPQFIPQVVKRLKKELVNVESILRQTIDALAMCFQAIRDEYLRERAIDLKDVGDRILRYLLGLEGPGKEIGNEPFVLVAEEVTPTELLDFSKGKLQGICLDSGGATSHVAILSGALGIPALFGLVNLSQVAHTGQMIIVNSRNEGIVVLNPDEKELQNYNQILKSLSLIENLATTKDLTKDGIEIFIAANISRVEELPLLQRTGINRIGLFRSEFLFMESVDLPGEAFQESVYRSVVNSAPEGVVLRVIDIGSDKQVKYLPFPRESNPAMGFRSIRFLLSRPDILMPQLRAMLKASNEKTKIIFPMVSTEIELEKISQIWEEALKQVSIAKKPEWGIMVEVPSAFFMFDAIAKHTKYISLGTNDLLQFVYGIDRTNERLADLANPLCLPFIRLLFYGISAAKGEGLKVGICGEMASDPVAFCVLLAMGVDELSMRPAALPEIRKLMKKIDLKALTRKVHEILCENSLLDVRVSLSSSFPELFAPSETS